MLESSRKAMRASKSTVWSMRSSAAVRLPLVFSARIPIRSMVWRAPTIERLPLKVASASSYASIPTATLGAHLGSRVRLLTAGGQLVEGRLQQIDGADVVVLVLRDGGSAQMRIPQAGIRDAMVRRAAPQ